MLGISVSLSLNAAKQGKQINMVIINVFITQNIKSKIPFSINSNTISFPMKKSTADKVKRFAFFIFALSIVINVWSFIAVNVFK